MLRPRCSSEISRMFSNEIRKSARTRLASDTNSRPAAVVSTRRVERWNSSTPTAFSTRCTVRVSAGWEIFNVSAAATKLPHSATMQMAWSSRELKSGSVTIDGCPCRG
ncbi:hypothetical protein D3C71_1690180 [compost metagenome]